MYDDDTDFRQVMEQLVSRRRKLCPIKLEYTRLMDESVLGYVVWLSGSEEKTYLPFGGTVGSVFLLQDPRSSEKQKRAVLSEIYTTAPGRYQYV